MTGVPFLSTSRTASLRLRAELLAQLEQLFRAGIGPLQALEMLDAPSLPLVHQRQLGEARAELAGGTSLAEAFELAGGPFAAIDLAHLAAGEASGRLPEACLAASERLDEKRKAVRSLWMALAYPLFLLHLAILFPWPESGGGGIAFPSFLGWAQARLLVLFVMYGSVGLAVLGVRALTRSRAGAEGFDAFLLRVPALGSSLRRLAIAELLDGFVSLVEAGLLYSQALAQAGAATGNRAIGGAAERAAELLVDGESLPVAFASEPQLGGLGQGIAIADTTGDIAGSLQRTARLARERAKTALRGLTAGVSIGAYLGVATYIGYRIIAFYAGYFQSITDVM